MAGSGSNKAALLVLMLGLAFATNPNEKSFKEFIGKYHY